MRDALAVRPARHHRKRTEICYPGLSGVPGVRPSVEAVEEQTKVCCSPLGACSAHAKTGLDAHPGPSAQTEAWQVVRSTRCAALDTGRSPLEMRQVCHGSDFACSAVGAHASNVVLAQPCQHARACCACLPARRRRIRCFCPLTCRRTDRLANFFERAATAGG